MSQKPPSDNDLQDLRDKIADLEARDDALRGEAADNSSDDRNGWSALTQGLRMGLEFTSGIAVGVAIGLGLDHWLDTSPWMLLLFLVLGFCAGLLNIYGFVKGIEPTIGSNRKL